MIPCSACHRRAIPYDDEPPDSLHRRMTAWGWLAIGDDRWLCPWCLTAEEQAAREATA